ncbi:amino acid ABC transporter substrate-binding protein [Bacterioplanes sanyensis]|uniref:Amino acid ABC transporter substrate-binding protein n=1 Tax=Bacterioplanes sanyensis TaxID=1249553 RepID=A0A222FJA6_9GAMM|nr:transporter substrate-binding domain-containing protein [Bacterioplanes sanyensis]ASP38574.1 amino acid ABC transporter substrate-binding protein [Bacterioplanes sanyensis]
MRIWLLLLCVFPLLALGQDPGQNQPQRQVQQQPHESQQDIKQVRIAIGEWPPYHDSKALHFGLSSHAIQQAFAAQGIEVKFEFYPWTRAFKMAQSGMVDGTGVWFATKERAQNFHISNAVMLAETVFFHRTAYDFDWSDYSDLQGLRVGIAQYSNDGQAFGEEFAQAQKQQIFSSSTAHDDRMLFTMLLHDRIDLFPIDKHAGLGFLQSDFKPQQRALFTFHPKPVRQDGGHLLLPRSNPKSVELLRQFNLGLKKIRDQGALLDVGLPPEAKP